MTNGENLRSLSDEEAAWFTMAYTGDNCCQTCIYKSYENCHNIADNEKLSCYDGHVEWLKRETEENEDDSLIFHLCRQNVLVQKRDPYATAANALSELHSFEHFNGGEDMDYEEYDKKYAELHDKYIKLAEKIGADEDTDVYKLLEKADAEYKKGLEAIGGWKDQEKTMKMINAEALKTELEGYKNNYADCTPGLALGYSQ